MLPRVTNGQQPARAAAMLLSLLAMLALLLGLVVPPASATDDDVVPAEQAAEVEPQPTEPASEVEPQPTTARAESELGVHDLGTFATGTNAPLACLPGTFYSLQQNGQVRQIVSGSTPNSAVVTTFGTFPQGSTTAEQGSQRNGLGIGPGGTVMYALERTSSSGGGVSAILKYSVADGWQRFASTAFQVSTQALIIGGAINPLDGNYYFGGFRTSSNPNRLHFDLYRFNTATNTIANAGTFNTGQLSGSNNGDIAFSAAGDLYVVRSNATDATIFAVPAGSVTGAGANTTHTFTTISPGAIGALTGVNGIAFDDDGSIYLGDGTRALKFDPSGAGGWTLLMDPVTTGLGDSGDLASCGTPPTLTVVKDVVGRAGTNDQFTLRVHSGNRELATVTTAGANLGVQTQQVGPIPVAAGGNYTISEIMASGTASNYSAGYVCVDERGVQVTSGTAMSGNITMPTRGGAAVVCTFTNAPLLTTVTVRKIVVDTAGENPVPGAGWTVSAVAQAQNGTITPTPSTTSQQTNASGVATWSLRYANAQTRATLTISETQQAGYEFLEGVCVVTPLGGSSQEVSLGAASTQLTQLAPGTSVDCTYVNRQLPTMLTLVKEVGFGTAAASAWQLSATGPGTAMTGPVGTTGVTAEVTPGVAYRLSETGDMPLYVQDGAWVCVNQDDETLTVTEAGDITIADRGDEVTCTVTNATATITLLKQVDEQVGNVTEASWTLTAAPAALANATLPTSSVVGADYVEGGNAANTFEVRPEHSYTLSEALTESGTPLAYRQVRMERLNANGGWDVVASQEITAPAAGETAVYRFVNERIDAVSLPLTGGTASDSFLIGGGITLLLALIGAAVYLHRRRLTA